MNPLVRHRLYLTVRFCAALLACIVVVPLAVVVGHDYVVQRADARCFQDHWVEAIRQARQKDAETVARKCTPEVVKILDARTRPSRSGAPFDPDAYLAQKRPLSVDEQQCFWARSGEIVGLPTDEDNEIARRCHVEVEPPGVADADGIIPDRRYTQTEMIADLRQAELAGDKQVEERISSRLKESRARPGELRLLTFDELPVEFQRRSTRAWRSDARHQRWGDDAALAVLALLPLITVVGLRRWVVWLTRPEP